MRSIRPNQSSAMQTTDAISIAFNIIGGLALFMYGITLLRGTLGKITGKRVARILEKTITYQESNGSIEEPIGP